MNRIECPDFAVATQSDVVTCQAPRLRETRPARWFDRLTWAAVTLVLVGVWSGVNWQRDLVAANAPNDVLLDFTASWCGPCQKMSPIVSRLQRQGLPIRKVDVDQEPDLARKYQIKSIPAFVLVQDGREVQRITGAASEATLREMLAKIASAKPSTVVADASEGIPKLAEPLGSVQLGAPRSPASGDATPNVADERSRKRRNWPSLGGTRGAPASNQAGAALNDAVVRAQGTKEPAPLAASVRIRIRNGQYQDYGSGTVLSSESGRAIVLTCGHLFRDLPADAELFVDVFQPGRPESTHAARVLKFNLDADVGVVEASVPFALSSVRLGSTGDALAKGDALESYGCSAGDAPTRQSVELTGVNRYRGPENLECSVEPAQGRSGGGLFRLDGRLVGVCVAADRTAHRGFYCALRPILQLLTDAGLSSLLPSRDLLAGTAPGVSNPEVPVPDDLFESRDALERTGLPAANVLPNDSFAMPEVAALSNSGVDAGEAEVICIVRDRRQPHAASQVIVIHQPSEKLMGFLKTESAPRSTKTSTNSDVEQRR